ncbi:MAG TPA: hypothetical protein GXX40_10425 [Firmicutes bacterium]|nr:hypothetical protein [Bacillota bacterium]
MGDTGTVVEYFCPACGTQGMMIVGIEPGGGEGRLGSSMRCPNCGKTVLVGKSSQKRPEETVVAP